jgi:hypothetical protein
MARSGSRERVKGASEQARGRLKEAIGLGIGRELRGRVGENVDRDLRLDRERREVDPFAREWSNGPGTDDRPLPAVGDHRELTAGLGLIRPPPRDLAGQLDPRGDRVDPFRDGLFLAQPDGCDLRVAEHNSRNSGIVARGQTGDVGHRHPVPDTWQGA